MFSHASAIRLGLGVLLLLAGGSASAQTSSLASEAKKNPRVSFNAQNRNQLFDGVLKEGARDVFELRLKADEVVEVTARSRTIDTLIDISSEEGGQETPLARDDDSGGERDAQLRFRAPPTKSATFYLAVSARSGQGNYTLEIRKQSVGKLPAPVDIVAGTPMTGKLDSDSPWRNLDGRSYQVFAFVGKAGDRLRILASPTDGAQPLELTLYGPDNLVLRQGMGPAPIVTQTLKAAGPHRIEVAFKLNRDERDANFNLQLDALPPEVVTAEPKAIAAGVPEQGQFGPTSPVLSANSSRPVALYALRGVAGDRFTVTFKADGEQVAKSASLSTRPMLAVGVESPGGFASVNEMFVDARSPRPLSFRFEQDGELRIRIVGSPGMEGGYTLLVQPYSPPAASAAPSN